jgi:hypothetical protein
MVTWRTRCPQRPHTEITHTHPPGGIEASGAVLARTLSLSLVVCEHWYYNMTAESREGQRGWQAPSGSENRNGDDG